MAQTIFFRKCLTLKENKVKVKIGKIEQRFIFSIYGIPLKAV